MQESQTTYLAISPLNVVHVINVVAKEQPNVTFTSILHNKIPLLLRETGLWHVLVFPD